MSNQTAPSEQFKNEEIHLQDYLNVILRRRRTFAIAFSFLFLLVALYTFIKKPVYEASAVLHVKDEKTKTGILGELALSNVSPVDSEIEIIKSRTNAEAVVKRLHLDWQVSKRSEGLVFKLLDFTSTEKEPEYLVELTGADTYSVRNADGAVVGTGKSGQLMQGKGVNLLINELKGKEKDQFRLELLPFNDTVNDFREVVKAVEVGKKTSIIRISYTDTDPVEARDVVNNLVQAYLDKTVALKSEEASRTVEFVETQLKGVREELDKAEGSLQGYKTSAGVVKLDTEAEELIKKFSETEKERAGVILQKKQIEFALASLKEAQRKGSTYSPAIMRDDPLVAGMATRLAELELQKGALLSDYTKEHPAVRTIQSQIEEQQRKLQATYETSRNNFAKQEIEISRRIALYEVKLKQFPTAERELVRLTRVAKVNGDIYTFLLQKHEEARIAKASTISNINIVDPAITPDRPIKPRKAKNLVLGLLVGCMFGVGLAFFHDYMDDTIKEGDEAKRITGFPILGTIPHIPHDHEGDEGLAETLITYHEPKSSAAEAFRTLRTALHFAGVGREGKTILLTSCYPGEGKTTISTNLAIIQAQTSARVLLMGCDLRRPSLHNMFRSERSPGLSEVLAGDAELAKVIRVTNGVGIDYISAGVLPPNPAELLGSERMVAVMSQLRDSYDFIVIDAPPMLAVADAQVLTPLADLVIVVIEAGRVPRKAGEHMRELLRSTSAHVAGVVINDRTGRGFEYYGSYGYRYGYGYYGDEAVSEKKVWWKRIFRPGKLS